MTDADLIISACVLAESRLMDEVERLDTLPWWRKLFGLRYRRGLVGATIGVIYLGNAITDICVKEGR